MRSALALLILAGFAGGCSNVLEGGGITESDVEAIQPGNGNGVIFSGTWKLQTTVSESTCGGLLPLLPATGDTDEEDISFVQTGGELTRGIDDLGDSYAFRGAVNQDGTFTYGQYYDLGLGDLSIRYIEIVDGKVELTNGTAAKLEGTAVRRYQSGLIDCSANVTLTGSRTAIGGGS